MNLRKNIQVSLLLILFFPIFTMAQDFMFSQFYSTPLALNPALAGNVECARIGTAYRNQWTAIPKAYNTYHLTYDQYIPSVKSGIGFILYNDQQADNALNSISGGGIYSFKFKLSTNTVVSLGLQAMYNQISLNWNRLVFSDQIQLNGEVVSVSNELLPVNQKVSYVDFSTGVAFDWKGKVFGGLAVHHLSEPVNSFYEDKYSVLPMRFTIHAGAYYGLERSRKSDILISPNILFQQQGKFHQLNLGTYIKFNYLVLGTWFRHNFENPDAIIAFAGFKKESFKIGYSYDMTISKLSVETGGTHEITLSYEFCIYKNDKKRKIRAIKCPEF